MNRELPVFRRLRIRLTIACSLVTGLVLFAMAIISLAFSEAQLRQRTENAFRSSLDTVFLYLRNTNSIDQSWLTQTETSGDLQLYLEDNGKPLLFGQEREHRLFELAAETASHQYGFSRAETPVGLLPESLLFPVSQDGVDYMAAVASVPVNGGCLSVTAIKPVPEIVQLRLTFAMCVASAFVCLIVFAWSFTARAIRPVAESRRQQTEFVSAASHELRSPLAVMQASADAMQDAPLEDSKRFARTIAEECTRLSRLTGDLLALAGADNSRLTLDTASAEPETLLLSASESFEPVAAQKQISLRVELPEAPLPRIQCDSQRVTQLLTILLDNAISYTCPGGHVLLQARTHGRSLLLSVQDNGPGIPDDQKRLIFGRFYRGDPSRSKKEHYGLGLSIAWEIVQLHRGGLTVEDAPGGGAVFTLSLPIG